MQKYKHVVVVGAGPVGLLAGLTFEKVIPDGKVTVIRSPAKPDLEISESTTPAVPQYLHTSLTIDAVDFNRRADPVWNFYPETTHQRSE